MNDLLLSPIRLSDLETLIQDSVRKVLSEVPKSIDRNNQSSDFLNIRQAAEFLGLAVPTVYGLVHRQEIVCRKPGKLLYFSKTDLLNYLEGGRKRSLSEIHEHAADKLKSRFRNSNLKTK